MLTARAITNAMVHNETDVCNIIVNFARTVIGNTSVGLNAVALVKDKYR